MDEKSDLFPVGTYGRNFDVDGPPGRGNRQARYYCTEAIPFGAPVVLDATLPEYNGMRGVKIATGEQPSPAIGGLILFEYHSGIVHPDDDPFLHTYSDHDATFAKPDNVMWFAQPYTASQILTGPTLKVVFTNTKERLFLGQRVYPGRLMISGTPQLGDLITPGAGTDVSGYWQVTTNFANAWGKIYDIVDEDTYKVVIL